MSRRFFFLLVLTVGIIALCVFQRQRVALAHSEAMLAAHREAAAESALGDGGRPNSAMQAPRAQPSSELLRLRGEVAVLRRELDDLAGSEAARAYSNDWQLVYSGPRPSESPDFVTVTNLVRAEFATPDSALQSWHYAFHHQQKEPITQTRMKEIWDVPDDFDQEPGYSIDMGEGLYGGIGFRIAGREILATNVVRLIIDYEKEDGSSYRGERILVERNGRWRVQPVRVTRVEPRPTPDESP